MAKGVVSMSEVQKNESIEESAENPNAKFFEELFITEEDRDMYCIDFSAFSDILNDWLDQEDKIDPNIARYMGMVLLGVAQRLEENENDNYL